MINSDPKSYNHPARSTLHEADVGQLGIALVNLTREVWVLSDRLAVMETVLAKRGIDISEEINSFQPDAEMQAQLDEKGAKLVSSVVNAIAGLSGLQTD